MILTGLQESMTYLGRTVEPDTCCRCVFSDLPLAHCSYLLLN